MLGKTEEEGEEERRRLAKVVAPTRRCLRAVGWLALVLGCLCVCVSHLCVRLADIQG